MPAEVRPPIPTLSLRKKLAFTLAVTLVLLLFTELGLRLVWERPPRFLGEHLRETGLFVRDPELGWRMRPNQSLEFTWSWGTATTITTNSAGYRDREYASQPEALRVMILGDSHAFGFGVDDNDLLSARLREMRPGTEVLNLAVTGYNVAQSNAALRIDGRSHRPDLVVLAFVLNDVTHQVIPTELTQREGNIERGMKDFLRERSRLYALVTSKINANKPLARLLVSWGIKDGLAGYESLDPNLRPFLKKYPQSLTQEWNDTLREIEEMRAVSEEASAQFAILIVPAKQSVVPENLRASLAYVDYSPEDFDLDKPYRAMKQFCVEAGITCLDPTARFRSAYQAGRNPYLAHDMHINPEGHRILADAIVAVIEANIVSPRP